MCLCYNLLTYFWQLIISRLKKNDEKQGAISNQKVIEKNLFLGQQVGHMVFSLLSDLMLGNFTGKINEVSDFNSYLVS